jgi:hypothetical protein
MEKKIIVKTDIPVVPLSVLADETGRKRPFIENKCARDELDYAYLFKSPTYKGFKVILKNDKYKRFIASCNILDLAKANS